MNLTNFFCGKNITPGLSVAFWYHKNQGTHQALEKLIPLKDNLNICGWIRRASKCDRKEVREESSIVRMIVVTRKK